SLAIAKDPQMLSLAAHCRKGERAPNLCFAAVHLLLLKGTRHPLSLYYKSLSGSSLVTDDPYPTFRSFCLEYDEEIRSLISARMGIDVKSLDVSDREYALWLRALVWPEHSERAEVLRQALQVARQNPPTLIRGDGVESLPAVIEAVPKDSVLCIVRMFTPIAPISRDRLSSLISSYGA